jgi:hypothetical protein
MKKTVVVVDRVVRALLAGTSSVRAAGGDLWRSIPTRSRRTGLRNYRDLGRAALAVELGRGNAAPKLCPRCHSVANHKESIWRRPGRRLPHIQVDSWGICLKIDACPNTPVLKIVQR